MILKWAVYVLAGAIGVMVLGVFLRETWRALARRRFERLTTACAAQIQVLQHLDSNFLASELKASYPLPVIEKCLQEVAEGADPLQRHKLIQVNQDLGIVQARVEALKSSSWIKRAAAAERLGHIGHSGAVLPLIAVLEDPSEDAQVKSAATSALQRISDPRAIEPLVEALARDDAATSRPVADALEALGERAVPALQDVLRSSKAESQRYWAARILGASTAFESATHLIAALQDRSEKVRAEAARSLGKLEARQAIHPLTNTLLRDPRAPVREEAARALGEIGDERALEALSQALNELPYEVRAGALAAMEKMGDKAIPHFLQALEEEDKRTRTQAATALERSGYVGRQIERLAEESGKTDGPAFLVLLKIARTGVVESLIQALSYPDLRVRARVCQILGEARSQSALDPLSDVVRNDSEWAVRARALEALIRIGDDQTRDLWLGHLREEEEDVRELILDSMRGLSPSALRPMLPELLPYLNDPNLEIRKSILSLVASVRSQETVSWLIMSLDDWAPEVRAQAASALGNFPQEEAVRALERCLEDPESMVRASAVHALGKIKDPTSIPALAEAFETAEDSYRDDIAQALAAMKQDDLIAVTDLLMGLRSGVARAGVAYALGLRRDRRVLPLLEAFLKDEEPFVRASAARAMGEFASPETGVRLLPFLEDPDARVRAATLASLGRCQDTGLADRVVPLLADPDIAVGRQAALAIGQLFHPLGITHIQRFHARAVDPLSQAAALIGLALLDHETGLETVLEGLQSSVLAKPLRDLIRTCNEQAQERFFGILALDPGIFWLEEKEEFRPRAVEHYVGLLRSSRQPSARVSAMRALALFAERRCVPILETSLTRDPNATVRVQALASLVHFLEVPELLDRLVVAIRDPADEVRLQAAHTLNGLDPDAVKPHRERLIELLETENDELQGAVCSLLARCYQRDWRSLADRLMGTEKMQALRGLIRTLSLIGDPQSGVLFLPLLDHRDSDIRILAAEQLPHVSSRLPRESLLKYLEDPNERVRTSIVRCLGRRIGAEEMAPLVERVKDPSPLVRQEVAAALGRASDLEDEQPALVLMRMARDSSVIVRAQALASLIRLGVTGHREIFVDACRDLDEADIEALRARLSKDGTLYQMRDTLKSDSNPQKRADALHFLARMDLEQYTSDIVPALKDPSSAVRIAAIEVLGRHEDPRIQAAIEALEDDPDGRVREAVKRRKLRSMSPRRQA